MRNVIERRVVTSSADRIVAVRLALRNIKQPIRRDDTVLPTLAEITETAEKLGIEHALAANDHHRELTAGQITRDQRTDLALQSE